MKKLVSGYGTGGIRTRESLRFARFQAHVKDGAPKVVGDLTTSNAACASAPGGTRDAKEGSAAPSAAQFGHTFRPSPLDRALRRPRGFIVPDAALGGAALLACAIAAIIGFSVAAESVEYMHDELVAARADQAALRVEVEQLGDRVADDDATVIASEDLTAWFRALAHAAIVESDRCALEACSCWQAEAP